MKPSFHYIRVILFGSLLLAGCSTPAPVAPTVTPTPQPTPAPAAGTILWTYQTGDMIWSSPTVSAGVIYFGSDDKNVYALDIQTHQLLWKFVTGGFVRSHPAVAGDTVYATSDDGSLYALDAATGAEKWRASLGSLPPRKSLSEGWDYQQSSPVVADGRIYAGSSAKAVYAFDAVSGEQEWQFDTPSMVRSTAAVSGSKVFIGDGSGLLHALDAATGSEAWNAQGCDIPTPAVVDGLVYCGSRGTFQVRAWDVQTGEMRWSYFIGGSWVDSSP